MKKLVYISSVILLLVFSNVYAESGFDEFDVRAGQSTTRSYWMDEGGSIGFTAYVSGGSGNDINLIITSPSNSKLFDGRITNEYGNNIAAFETGYYEFEFDNTFSIFSSKNVRFDYLLRDVPSESTIEGIDGIFAVIGIAVTIIVAIVGTIIVIKMTRKNKRKQFVENDEKTPVEEDQDNDALAILKERLAKGEITKEEYDDLKKEFT